MSFPRRRVIIGETPGVMMLLAIGSVVLHRVQWARSDPFRAFDQHVLSGVGLRAPESGGRRIEFPTHRRKNHPGVLREASAANFEANVSAPP